MVKKKAAKPDDEYPDADYPIDTDTDGEDSRPENELPPICDCAAMDVPHRHMLSGPVVADRKKKVE